MKTELRSQFRATGYLLLPVLLVGALLLASCATTPKPTPATTKPATQPATQPAQKPQVPAPTAELQKAKSMKAEIDQYNLGPLVPDAYKLGNDDLAAGQQAIGTDNATAKNKLDAAVAAYQQVLDTGIPIGLKNEAEVVAKARSGADAAKADKAVPDLYQQAVSEQQQAEAKGKSNTPADAAEAYSLYQQAASDFAKAEAQAKQKRAEAEAALQQADSQIGQTKTQVEAIQNNLESSLSSQNSANGGGQ